MVADLQQEELTEIRAKEDWKIAFGAALGMMAGNAPISLFSFGALIKPLQAQHGWDRAQVSLAPSLAALFATIWIPFLGAAIDRWGLKRVMVPGILAYALNLALIGQAAELPVFIALVALTGITGAVQTAVGYAKSVASHFESHRGLALGITMAGTGLGTAILPLYIQSVLSRFGLAYAYPSLALVVLVLALPSVIFFLREPNNPVPRSAEAAPDTVPGATLHEALRSRVFWLLAASVLSVSTVTMGVWVHIVPLLTDHGMSPGDAAKIMSAAGAATIAGRLLTGFLVDRIFAPMVGATIFLTTVMGLYLLVTGASPVAGAVLVGYATGTEVDLIGYLVSRYFGMKRFGQIYGYIFAAFGLGASAGPFLAGTLAAERGYSLVFSIFAVLLVFASGLMLCLGHFPAGEAEGIHRDV
jgi:MFS family permease